MSDFLQEKIEQDVQAQHSLVQAQEELPSQNQNVQVPLPDQSDHNNQLQQSLNQAQQSVQIPQFQTQI